MAYTLSPGYDATVLTANNYSNNNTFVNMPPQPSRRASRSSGSQSGSRPNRVEKPRSNHNSPRIMERRKTTTGPTKKYATLDDHYNFMFGNSEQEEVEAQHQTSRPMSWHPSSSQFQVPPRSSMPGEQQHDNTHYFAASSRNSTHGSDYYSLSTRNSMFSDQVQAGANPLSTHRGSQDSDSSWQTQAHSASSYSTPASEPMPWYLQEWAKKNQAQNACSRNGSSDFLPIQHPSTDEPNTTEEEMDSSSGKELIGMGLYDLPEPALSWSSGLVERTGKGLKLEETWQPPENDDDDEDAEGDIDDASSDDVSVEDLPVPPPPPPPQPAHAPAPITKPQLPGSMDGQSFFFDEDDSYTKEWWFQQLKQPQMPVRDAGLGYGWL